MRVGVARLGEELVPLPALDDLAAVEHVDLVAQPRDDPEVVGDHDERRAGVLHELLEQGEDLGLDRHVERRRRLVGDEQPRLARQRHRDERPLPHPARELVGVVGEAPLRVGDADLLEHLLRDRHRRLARHPLVPLEHLGDLHPDGDDGIQRGQRILEDHAEVGAAAVAHLVRTEGEQVGALVADAALDGVAALGQQTHDRQRRHRLAAAGLADDADGLAGAHVEADVVDGREGLLALAAEGDPQVADREQRLARGGSAGAVRRRCAGIAVLRHRAHRPTSGSWGRGPRAATRP